MAEFKLHAAYSDIIEVMLAACTELIVVTRCAGAR
jgi:hypothetical protein